MTNNEKQLITNADALTPFRVLQIDDAQDLILLRSKSIDVDVSNVANDKTIQLFIERLKLTMQVESGVGIAAPQVGLLRNILLFVRINEEQGYPVEVAINPRIIARSAQIVCFEGDGCLSVPDESGNTNRYAWIDVEYWNEKGELIKERLSGYSREEDFTGVIFQHEYDHLQGILFTDRLCQ